MVLVAPGIAVRGRPWYAAADTGTTTAATPMPQINKVIRLMIAEAPHFPALLQPGPEDRPVQRALANRLAELGEQGILEVTDPDEAAEFLGLLVTGRVNHRSWYGTVELDDTEIDQLATGGVQVFLRAYRPRPHSTSGQED